MATFAAGGIGLYAQTACIWEATARKVGNVHPGQCFADTEFVTFLNGAAAIGAVFDRFGPGNQDQIATIGHRAWHAVKRMREYAGRNTHLGIVLLLSPLIQAEYQENANGFRDELVILLDRLTTRDAFWVYQAIRLANPGGLGDAPQQDVRDEPTVTLLEAMKLAADRDMIARQYANGFADVFDFGTPAFLDAFAKFGTVEAAIVDCQLRWLAAFPDSLIARKNGLAVAEDVQKRAAAVLELGGIATPEGRAAGVALDRHLRSDGNRLNPGTTADLIAACLFVALREGKILPSAPFRWSVPDWL